VREHGDDFLARHGINLSSVQKKALRDVGDCGTVKLGGHVFRCVDCGADRIAYNSCRNRHCPTCRSGAPAEWLDRQADHLLPCEYFHVVFTLPSQVDQLAKLNPVTVYNALFQATAETLKQVSADPRHLGAEVGFLLVLHTWGQMLNFHPHIHGVVTGGGLACDRHGKLESPPRWVSCSPGFFLPVKVLSAVFRGKFLALIREAFEADKLLGFADAAGHAKWECGLRSMDWVVYSKPPFGGPEVVLKYLSLYTHRVAISDRRLESLEDGQVTFTAKDYRREGKVIRLTMAADAFLNLWVQHILPRGFVKIRMYGLLASRHRVEKIDLCRKLLWPKVALRTLTPVPAEPREEPACEQCGCQVWRKVGEVGRVLTSGFRCAKVDSS